MLSILRATVHCIMILIIHPIHYSYQPLLLMPNEGRKRKKVHVHCNYNLLLHSLCFCLSPSLTHTHTFCRLLNDEDILFINLLNLSSSCSSTTVVGVIISPYFFLITSSLNISGNLAYKEIAITLIACTCTY